MYKGLVHSLFLLFLLSAYPAKAETLMLDYVPDAKIVGEGRLSIMFWDIYDAALYAPSGQWGAEKPFALKLTYMRNIKGKKIASRSVEEMRKQGFIDEVKLATWYSLMEQIFPDVKKGDSLTGVYTDKGKSIFYKNGEEIGQISDKTFSKKFFNIWLDQKTSEPELREKLLGAI